jgi:hypothetical protein
VEPVERDRGLLALALALVGFGHLGGDLLQPFQVGERRRGVPVGRRFRLD